MHDLTIAAACRLKASTHTQHHRMMMMIMMKSNGTAVYIEEQKNDKDGLGQLVFCRKYKDNHI
jgi:hypothetical protein